MPNDSLNSKLGDGAISFSVVDGEPYVKVGADPARPFKSNGNVNAMDVLYRHVPDHYSKPVSINFSPSDDQISKYDYFLILVSLPEGGNIGYHKTISIKNSMNCSEPFEIPVTAITHGYFIYMESKNGSTISLESIGGSSLYGGNTCGIVFGVK